jgi:hypothetical protein
MNAAHTRPQVGMTVKGYTIKGIMQSKSKSFPGSPAMVFFTMLLENAQGVRRCAVYNPETGSISDFQKEQSGSTKGNFYKVWYDCDLMNSVI